MENNRYARGALCQTYSHVFLDEFQDATRNQYEFVKAAFLGTDAVLTAVGDVKQRIMAWAGALDGIMKKFSDDFEAASLPLYQNFRSASRLRRMQNRMIEDMDPAAASPDEDLMGDEGVSQVLHYDSQAEEAEAVVDLINGWLDEGVPPSQIAVLVCQQSKQVTEALAEELHDRGIPYRNEQDSQDLAAEPVAALIFDFVWVVAGDHRPAAYAELMRVASRSSATDEAALQFTASSNACVQVDIGHLRRRLKDRRHDDVERFFGPIGRGHPSDRRCLHRLVGDRARVDFSPADHNPLGASATSDGRYPDMGQPHLAAAGHHPRGSLGGGALTRCGTST